jgi:hypothetical protein
VEVHYRWHPLYGRRLRQQYSEQRAGGRVVHVEATPGVIIVLAAWMLDPAACAGMKIGVPRADVGALSDLHRLLVEHGFRRSSLGDPRIAKEKQNEQFVAPPVRVRRHFIPKADGTARPLGIPTLEDKVAQRAILLLLEPI